MLHGNCKTKWIVLATLMGLFTGCNSLTTETGTSNSNDNHKGGNHTHAGHSHGHWGPNGGHLIELGDGEYHAEWLHEDDTGKVTVIILDEKSTKEVAIAADQLTIDVVVGESRKTYQLKAIGANDEDDSTASRFETVDQGLLVALKVGEGVHATIGVEIDEKLYTGQLEHQEHDDHGHHH